MNINKFCKLLSMGSPKSQQKAISKARNDKLYKTYMENKQKSRENVEEKMNKIHNLFSKKKNPYYMNSVSNAKEYDELDQEFKEILGKYSTQMSYIRSCLQTTVPKIATSVCSYTYGNSFIKYHEPYSIRETNTEYILSGAIYFDIFEFAKKSGVNVRDNDTLYNINEICSSVESIVGDEIRSKFPNISLKQNFDGDWDDIMIDIIIKK